MDDFQRGLCAQTRNYKSVKRFIYIFQMNR